jgi:cell surface protein SprA
MTKKHHLLAAISFLSLCTLFAFTLPERLREEALTLFIPEEKRSVAEEYKPLAIDRQADRKKNARIADGLVASVIDTPPPPLKDRFGDFINNGGKNPIDLKDPKAVEQKVEYDPITNRYILTEKIGDEYYRAPTYMTFEEYLKWRDRKQQQQYFDRLQGVASASDKSRSGIVDPISKFEIKTSLIDRLFGGTNVDIRPNGNINLIFGYNYQNTENPILAQRQQRQGIFDFDMDINMSAQGKIGEKLNLDFNYNTQATFDFDNQMKLQYDTKNFSEDEILQNIKAGNVSLPLRSNLIKGAQNLFGIKADMKFGHLRTTLIASQQKSRQQQLTLQGGSQIQTFEKPIDEYDENRHFFLSHWNRGQFEPALKCLPVPQSLFTITRMEVWITNDRLATENVRDIVALADLGEPDSVLSQFKLPFPPMRDITNTPLPDNKNNRLYDLILDRIDIDSTVRFSDKIVRALNNPAGDFQIKQIANFEKQRCRLLSPSEYSYNDQLGFVSINLNVQPDQIVGISVEYTYNGEPHKIGEFTSDVPNGDSLNQNVLFVKMLKSTAPNIKLPIWDLMMKNVYAIGSVNVDPQEFRFDIFYEDPGKGQKRFLDGPGIPQSLRSKPLLQVFRLDSLNLQGDPGPDGIFDFVPGLTINLRSGRIMFPVLEPFGKFLGDKLRAGGASDSDVKRYIYPHLYDSTLFRAREFQELNRFTLRGSYKSSSASEISLGTFNLPQGSVKVSAGGRQLIEGADYQVDYNIGKVKILNDAILQSGQSVNVNFEDNSLFSFQQRTMVGARFDYEVSKNLNIGATYMQLFERPLTQKVNYGDDPINNRVFGLDFNLSKDAPWLTKFMDKLPLISTKEPSTITAQAEVAGLKPSHNKAINQGDDGGIVYIDDFEGSTANLRIDFPTTQWVMASVPQGDETLFPETRFTDTLLLGVNRGRMSWFIPDPGVIGRGGLNQSRPYTRIFGQQDLFPNRDLAPTEQSNLRGFDVTFYPRERGPYNFDRPGGTDVSKGLTVGGALNQPQTRWGGIMRGLNTQNDFEAANIEFIEFWMLNPYMNQKDGNEVSREGDMYIDLGSISEDIMRDSRQFFENALPTGQGTGATVNSRVGRVPVLPPVVNAFDNNPEKRKLQDLGLDGLNDEGEAQFYREWIDSCKTRLSQNALDSILADPANDNFVFYGSGRFNDTTSVLERYRKFNGPQGNSPANTNSGGNGVFQNPSSTNLPDVEDLNRDNSLNETEAYFRYRIPLAQRATANGAELDVDAPVLKDLITDTVIVRNPDGEFIWYRFKLPLDYATRQEIGGIQDFRSIRFIRMFYKGFTERTTFRFATLELGRNQWRRYSRYLDPDAQCPDSQFGDVAFDVNAVTIEENAARTPFNYTIPNGIQRENSVGAFPDVRQNEQSLSVTVCDLPNCDARAIFKTLNMDLRQFKKLRMFVHAEDLKSEDPVAKIEPGDMKIFIRMGSDFTRNYYEYEIPLAVSDIQNLNGNPDSRSYKDEVWRPENNFNFPLEVFTDIKKQRNAQANPDLGIPFSMPYTQVSDHDNDRSTQEVVTQAEVKIVGNPNLGYVKNVMVGIRNVDSDPNNRHCVEVWLNELRLNGFNEKGGYAGQARVDVKLADLGNVSMSGNYTSIGWGALDQRLVQRQREEVIQLDVSANIELGKLLPEKSGLKVPVYLQYSNTTRNPEYDPYDLDIKLKDKLRAESNSAKRDSIRSVAQDVSIVRGYNFTNVRKERRGNKKPMPWDVSNFSFTYAYNQLQRRTPFIIKDEQNQYKGAVDYQYATGLKPFTPFKKLAGPEKLIKNDKYLKFITDFNFNPVPNTFGFSTNVERLEAVTTYRFAGEDPKLNTYYNRRFVWDRNYDLGWDISRGLRFNFDATARSLIDEPLQFDTDGTEVTRQQRKDSILTNIRNLGRPKNYTHNASVNYTLPTRTIPFMDWITVKASYTAGYTWTAQSLKLQNMQAQQFQEVNNSRNLGNVIQNNSVRQLNGDFNFENLYNKSKYLSKINKPVPKKNAGKSSEQKPKTSKAKESEIKKTDRMAEKEEAKESRIKKTDRMAGKEEAKPKTGPDELPEEGDKVKPGGRDGVGAVKDRSSRKEKLEGDKADEKNKEAEKEKKEKAEKEKEKKEKAEKEKAEKEKEKKDREPSMAERVALRPLMLLRKARFTYSENYNTVIPGFTPEPKLMGLSEGFSSPGWAFVAGLQPATSWLDEAGRNGWITHRPELNQQVTRNYTQNMDGGVTVEPFQDFRVEITANRQYTKNNTELFKDQNFNLDPTETNFQHRAQRDLGSFTVSYFAMNTLFGNDINGLFEQYELNRQIVSNRLGRISGNTGEHEKDPGYSEGYGRIQQEVLVPSFVAAYTGKDANTVSLDLFKTLPSLNWRLNYNGLSKVGNLSKLFSSIQISHGYKSSLTVNSYNTDLFFSEQRPYTIDSLNFNYIARYEIPQVVISEQMQPLLGVDVKMKNDMTLRLNFNKSRILAMSFIDYQLAETKSSAYTFGFGYRLKNVNIPFLTGKKTKKSSSSSKKKKKDPLSGILGSGDTPGQKAQSNDMNFKFDFEIRDDITVNHRLDQLDEAIPTRGARMISINPQVEYALNRRLKLRLFTDYRRTVPKTSQSFPITTMNAGVTVQFTLN